MNKTVTKLEMTGKEIGWQNREKGSLYKSAYIKKIKRHLISRVLLLEIKDASLALQVASLFESMSSRGMSSMLSI